MEWMRKHTAIVIWVIVIAFGIGVVWWSVGAYIGGQSGAAQSANQAPSPSQAIALVTKGGTPLSYNYWIMPTDFNNYMQNVNANYKNTYGQDPDPLFVEPQLELNTIETLVNQEVINYFAKNSNITVSKTDVDNQINSIVNQYKSNPQALNYINQQYGSLQNFENFIRPQVEESLISQQVMSVVVNVTQSDVQNYYETNKATIENTYDQVKIAHISLSSQATANKVISLIKSGNLSFSQAAKDYSLDTTTAATGGEIGWLTRQQLGSLANQIFSATPGSVIGPLQTSSSWEIINVEAKKLYDNFDSVVQATSIYNTLVNDVKQQKFTQWLNNYKNQNDFSYQLEGQVLPYFKEFYSIPSTDTAKIEQFIQNMKSYIYPSGQATVNTSVDPRLLALFEMALESYKTNLTNQYSAVLSYHANAGSFPATYIGVPVSVLQQKLNEVQNSMNTATGTNFTKLFSEQTDLQTAINFNKALETLKTQGYTTDAQINAQYDKYNTLVSQINDEMKQVLTAIYQLVPYSTVAVSKLYTLDPSNQQVALSYFQDQYNLLKPIISNPQAYQAYGAQINSMFSYVISGLQSLAYTGQSTSIKQGALVTLISMAQDLNNPQEELTYLKQLKAVNPNYQGIDQVIAQVQSAITSSSTKTSVATSSAFSSSPVSAATPVIPTNQASQFKP